MKNCILLNNGIFIKVGQKIKIMELKDEPNSDYVGRVGTVESIDDAGQLHGTWGGLAIIPEEDRFIIIPD